MQKKRLLKTLVVAWTLWLLSIPSTEICAQGAIRQSIETVLVDQSTKEPIKNAFIFIRNTSISTISDITGFFQLDITAFPTSELVITHLSYQTITIALSPNI